MYRCVKIKSINTKLKGKIMKKILTSLSLCILLLNAQNTDPLPSWKDGKVKQAIIHFVTEVSDPQSANYVPVPKRIATFDNDGTLWTEYPIYTQGFFAADQVKKMKDEHPEWKNKQPFKALLENDTKAIESFSMQNMLDLVFATHSGMSIETFQKEANTWLKTTNHPKFKHPYIEVVYQPQLELLEYLRAHEFKTFIVSGGGITFIRSFAEEAYGIPPEQVVGTSLVSKFQKKGNKAEIIRMPKINFINDHAGKPVGIYQHIGRRPIFAFGNSDADMQMIEYTMAGEGLRLGLFLHHTDDVREYAYDRKSLVGSLNKALDIADKNNWMIVDMKKEWKIVFPFDKIK